MVVPAASQVRLTSGQAVVHLVREQQQVVAGGADAVLEADEHFLEERMLKIGMVETGGEDDADHPRPLGDERSSGLRRRVFELLRHLEHAPTGLLAHVRVVVEDA